MEVVLINSVRRWKRGLTEADSALVFSPYITSSTAESVLCAVNPSHWEVHTVFDAMHFANGGSSIRTLRNLHKQGCKLYHIQDLHAKIFFVPDQWASIGSQNLTSRGTRNREASVFLRDPVVLKRLNSDLEIWLQVRQPISEIMLDEMEQQLPKLRKLFRQLSVAVEAANELVAAREVSRQKELELAERESERKKLEEHKAKIRLEQFQKSIASLKYSVSKYAMVDVLPTGAYGGSSTHSLSAPGRDLTKWISGGSNTNLIRTFRYLTVIEKTGKLGWARVAQTRITFVEKSISWSDTILLADHRCTISAEAEWDESRLKKSNLKVKLSNPGILGSLHAICWFTPSGIEILSFEEHGIPEHSPLHSIRVQLQSDSTVRLTILRKLLSPFKYQSNLTGVEAHNFFGPVGTWFRISLAHAEGKPLLVAKHH